MNTFKILFKKPMTTLAVVLILIIALSTLIYFYFYAKAPVYGTVQVRTEDLVEKVDLDGTIKPAHDVDLAFETGGKVASVSVGVGSKVSNGQVLSRLENSTLKAQLDQVEAALETQQAKLAQLKAGARPEEVSIKRDEVNKAQTSLVNSYAGIPDALNSAYAGADDAVRVQTAALFYGTAGTYRLAFSSCDSQSQIDAEALRQSADGYLSGWQMELEGLSSSSDGTSLDRAIADSQNSLANTKKLFDKLSYVVSVGGCSFSQSAMAAYLSPINAGKNEIIAGVRNLDVLKQTLDSEKIAIQQASSDLQLTLAGSTPEEIAAQEAQVKAAQANVELATAQLGKTELRSPLDGLVTREDAKTGEIVSTNSPLISVISTSQFQIEAYAPEDSAAKLKAGDEASVTLDAYGDSSLFPARVIGVDPAATAINGSPVYKVTLQFLQDDQRIKSGLSVNADITSAEAKGVLVLPRRTVITRDDKKIVLVASGNGSFEEREVTTGIEGGEGNVEITSGLKEGDQVADFGQ